MDIVICKAYRTAVGNFHGSIATIEADDLGAQVIKQLVDGIDPSKVSEVIMGQVLTAAKGQNTARQALIKAGIPHTVPGFTINQVCGSGLKSVALAYQAILAGDANMVVAGGQESMSNAVHASYVRRGVRMGDTKMIDTMIHDGLTDIFNNYHMGITAENIAEKFNISRQEQDEFACASQNKAEKAKNKLQEEIVDVKYMVRREECIFNTDEFIKDGSTVENLAKLKPAFKKDGTVTAGNASGINDGAAAVLVMKLETAKQLGLQPMAKIVAYGQSGVEPEIMGTGPVQAVKNALTKANWKIDDLDLIEANEAFASQAIAVNKELGWDLSKVNVNGGAIAIGHPIGASGTRVLVTLLHEMQRREANRGLCTLCIGGGMGIALCVSREGI